MNFLALDTSGVYLSAVMRYKGKYYEKYIADSGVNHSVEIMPCAEELFNMSEATPYDMDVFCAVVGPGSFTGIRIGVATAKGFADAAKKKVLAVTSFDTIAYNKTSDRALAVINARHDNFYVCGYEKNRVCLAPSFVSIERVRELSKEYELLSYEAIDGLNVEVVNPLEGLKAAACDKIDNATYDSDNLKPFYLRLSQAEEGRI